MDALRKGEGSLPSFVLLLPYCNKDQLGLGRLTTAGIFFMCMRKSGMNNAGRTVARLAWTYPCCFQPIESQRESPSDLPLAAVC